MYFNKTAGPYSKQFTSIARKYRLVYLWDPYNVIDNSHNNSDICAGQSACVFVNFSLFDNAAKNI